MYDIERLGRATNGNYGGAEIVESFVVPSVFEAHKHATAERCQAHKAVQSAIVNDLTQGKIYPVYSLGSAVTNCRCVNIDGSKKIFCSHN